MRKKIQRGLIGSNGYTPDSSAIATWHHTAVWRDFNQHLKKDHKYKDNKVQALHLSGRYNIHYFCEFPQKFHTPHLSLYLSRTGGWGWGWFSFGFVHLREVYCDSWLKPNFSFSKHSMEANSSSQNIFF